MTGRMTTTGTRRGRRGNTATGTKAKVGLLNRYSFRFFYFVDISRMLCPKKKHSKDAKSSQLRFSLSETIRLFL